MKKVSIIIPVYNGEKYIKRCINSIINQTYLNIEILVIDDGSYDNTPLCLKELSKDDDRIKIIQKENEGVSIARNTGINLATGDYICFIDADDWIEKDWIELLVSKIEETSADVIRGNYIRINSKNEEKNSGNLFELENRILKNNDLEKIKEYIVIGRIPAYTPLLLIKTNIIRNRIYFPEKIHFMEDTVFYIELLNNIKSIYFFNYTGYKYFFNTNSAVKNPDYYFRNIENIKNTNKILKRMLDVKIYSKMAIVHISIIVEYVSKLYKSKKIKIKDIYNIFEKKDFKMIVDEINIKDLKNNKIVLYIKKRNKFMIKLYFIIRKNISRFRDYILGAR